MEHVGNYWSCPKCKHGGDREHTRVPGKCKLAPKVPSQAPKAKAAPARKPAAEPAMDAPEVAAPDPIPLDHQVTDDSPLEPSSE